MISLAARGGVPIESIIDQLNSCGTCPSYAVRRATKKDTSKGSCCPIAIGYALQDMYNEMQAELGGNEPEHECDDVCVADTVSMEPVSNMTKCPQCGEMTFVNEGGCNSCKICGHSDCN
jgi:ribonucleoside-diphosphate reductase alpha chain